MDGKSIPSKIKSKDNISFQIDIYSFLCCLDPQKYRDSVFKIQSRVTKRDFLRRGRGRNKSLHEAEAEN